MPRSAIVRVSLARLVVHGADDVILEPRARPQTKAQRAPSTGGIRQNTQTLAKNCANWRAASRSLGTHRPFRDGT